MTFDLSGKAALVTGAFLALACGLLALLGLGPVQDLFNLRAPFEANGITSAHRFRTWAYGLPKQ